MKDKNTTTIKGLPHNCAITLNGEDYLLENGTLVFDGGVELDFSKTFINTERK